MPSLNQSASVWQALLLFRDPGESVLDGVLPT